MSAPSSFSFRHAVAAVALLAVATTAQGPGNSTLLNSCLSNAGVSYLVSSNGDSWTKGIQSFNQRLEYTPIALVQPTSALQVAAAVKCGVDAAYWINARGGGHSYASGSFGGEDYHLLIDLKQLNQITVYGEYATIGGGSKLGDVAVGLDAQGRGLAHGVCPYVGIGGHGVYGGFGFFSRNWGMVVDQVTSLEVVTFDGQIRNVSSTGNDTDLFYAMRGAGGSFGIVTAFGVKTHAAPSSVVYATYTWDNQPANVTASMLAAYQNFSITAPKEWGSTLNMNAGYLPGTVNSSFTITYVGDQTTFENDIVSQLLNKFPSVTKPSSVTNQSWKDTLQLLAGNQNLNTSKQSDYQDSFYAKSIMTPEASLMTAEALSSFSNFLGGAGVSAVNDNQQHWFVQVELYGGQQSQINAVPVNDTSFVHRSSLFTIQFYASSWSYGLPYKSTGIDLVDGMVQSITGSMQSGWPYEAYQNYIDTNLNATDAQNLYYGSSYTRLQSIKQTYDPRNVFKLPSYQAIGLPATTSYAISEGLSDFTL